MLTLIRDMLLESHQLNVLVCTLLAKLSLPISISKVFCEEVSKLIIKPWVRGGFIIGYFFFR